MKKYNQSSSRPEIKPRQTFKDSAIDQTIESNIDLLGRDRIAQAIQLEEEDNNLEIYKAVKISLIAFSITIVGLLLAPARRVVTASGQIKPYGSVNVIQHNEGGIVQEVHVKNGDFVKQGDLIVTLSPKDATYDIAAVSARLDGLILKQQQLKALINNQSLSNISDNEGLKSNKIFQSQEQVLESKRKSYENAINELSLSIKERQSKVDGLVDRLNYEQNDLLIWQNLVANGAASKIKLNEILKNIAITKSQLKESEARLNIEKVRLNELKERVNLDAKTELAEAISEEAVINENIKKLILRLERTKIRATSTGKITDLNYQAPGSVVMPGFKVATIVPAGRENVAEIKINSKDIGFVEKGQMTDVKILPYDPSIYGSLKGKILSISGSSTQDASTGKFYYLTSVKLESQEITRNDKTYQLQPGMPVESDILADKTNVLFYLLNPILRSFQ